ncbi:protein of unknown function [Magnetospirillum sp. XM-1]|uniref:hypothetical protein n=1 Tax=Magnetospirillum sp. XM-1 TaxID=1663591 RepID=UPI00073E0A1D|nr:hypothetical protein [Magnetospirillum sp. XM-1]CUW41173.1 protein of unknown function [Magnetospirillum sp. XM-1]
MVMMPKTSLSFVVLMVSGCVSSHVADTIDNDGTNITMAGTPQVIRKSDEWGRVDLKAVVERYSACDDMKASSVDEVLAKFRTCSGKDEGADKVTAKIGARNSIQRYVMMVADRRCEVYKQSVSEIDSISGMSFGTLSTVTGVLGGLFTEAAQGLSATAGISSGLNAEFNKAFFKNTAVPVIFAGIDMKRLEIAKRIGEKAPKDIATYSLEAALSDAIQYNGACSAIEGMKTVQEALSNPVDVDAVTGKRMVSSYRQQCVLRAQGTAVKAKDGSMDYSGVFKKCEAEASAMAAALGVNGETPPAKASAPAGTPAPAVKQ